MGHDLFPFLCESSQPASESDTVPPTTCTMSHRSSTQVSTRRQDKNRREAQSETEPHKDNIEKDAQLQPSRSSADRDKILDRGIPDVGCRSGILTRGARARAAGSTAEDKGGGGGGDEDEPYSSYG